MKKHLIIAFIFIFILTGCSSKESSKTDVPVETDSKNVVDDSEKSAENKFDVLSIESRMERVLNDGNKYTWNIDDLQTAKECFVRDLFLMYGCNDSLKEYINDTYIYEIPSSLDFKGQEDARGYGGMIYDGGTYAYVYENIFGESIKTEDTVIIEPCDPPLIDTILVGYEQTDSSSYKIIGAYDGTGRIEITIDYGNSGMVIRSFKRYEEKGSIGYFKIEELKKIPSGNINLVEITNPAYFNESEENLTSYIFAIQGNYDVIGVFTKKTMDSEEEVYDLDIGGENIVLKYNTMFPTDFSQDTLLIRSAGGTEYMMQLNEAIDRELYLFEE